jgi:hypothetical protein
MSLFGLLLDYFNVLITFLNDRLQLRDLLNENFLLILKLFFV